MKEARRRAAASEYFFFFSSSAEERTAVTTRCVCDRLEKQKFFVKQLAQKLAHKWDKSNSEVIGWMRARLSFAILRASNLFLRGSRTKWRSAIGTDDGAGLPTIFASMSCFKIFIVYLLIIFICWFHLCIF